MTSYRRYYPSLGQFNCIKKETQNKKKATVLYTLEAHSNPGPLTSHNAQGKWMRWPQPLVQNKKRVKSLCTYHSLLGCIPVLVCSATATEYRRLGGLTNRNAFPHSLEIGQSKIKTLANSLPGESSSLARQWPPPHVLTWPFLIACPEERFRVDPSLFSLFL